MNGPDDIDMLAAEFVLGTLDAADRTAVAARRLREPALDAAIIAWEQRLGALDAATPPVAPPPDLFNRIEANISKLTTDTAGARVVDLERRVTRWKRVAAAATALAASLLLVVGARETTRPRDMQNFVAVFQKDDAQPAFMLSIDLVTRNVTIRPVTADKPAEKVYQLWIIAEETGPSPHSLGLLDAADRPSQRSLNQFSPASLQKATFGISLEPPGGSPTGRPTGPALHGTLLPARP